MKSLFSSKSHKKGALDLSINAIVVLILAITMLGLGLAFIRNLFGGAVEKLTGITEGLAEEDKKTLMTSQEQITFLSTSIKVSGREVNIPFAIRNVRGEKMAFSIQNNFFCFDAIGQPKEAGKPNTIIGNLLPTTYVESGAVKTDAIETDLKTYASATSSSTFWTNYKDTAAKAWIQFSTYDERDIEGNSAVVLPLNIKVTAGAPATTYSCAFMPVIVRKMMTATGATSATFTSLKQYGAASSTSADKPEIYSKQYFDIVYTK